MINTEMVENPVLEELEESSMSLDERAGLEGDRERSAEEVATETERVEKDPFDEIDFGSYFQDFLDPGFKTASSNFEEFDKPSFENFLSQPSTLSDHLLWQLGSLTLPVEIREAAELVVGNLNENGYLTATDEELAEALIVAMDPARNEPIPFERGMRGSASPIWVDPAKGDDGLSDLLEDSSEEDLEIAASVEPKEIDGLDWALPAVAKAREIINYLDPVGVGARDLKECPAYPNLRAAEEAAIVLQRRQANGSGTQKQSQFKGGFDVFAMATHIVNYCLPMLQKKRYARTDAQLWRHRRRGAGGGGVYPHPRPSPRAAL